MVYLACFLLRTGGKEVIVAQVLNFVFGLDDVVPSRPSSAAPFSRYRLNSGHLPLSITSLSPLDEPKPMHSMQRGSSTTFHSLDLS